jgi:enoyl-CoA hydratase
VSAGAPVVVDRTHAEGRVWSATLARPERRNAVDRATADALLGAATAFDGDERAGVLVLRGAGDDFCAGADLLAIARGEPNRVELEGAAPLGVSRLRLAKPVLAAIEGHAVAGGLELALWCDLRVASTTARLGVLCRRFGVPLVDGGTVRLPRLIGQSRALDLVLTGRLVDAEEALAMGLVNRVVPAGEAFASALALAEEIAAFPQLCLRHDRATVLDQCALTEAAALRLETERGLEVLASGETFAGATAFAEGAGRHGGKRDR